MGRQPNEPTEAGQVTAVRSADAETAKLPRGAIRIENTKWCHQGRLGDASKPKRRRRTGQGRPCRPGLAMDRANDAKAGVTVHNGSQSAPLA